MTEKTKHIVFFTPGFPESERDLNCVASLQNYVRYLSTIHPEFKITVISFQYPYQKSTYLWNDITVHSAGGKNKKYFFRLLTWYKVLRSFYSENKKQKADVIHAFWLTECSLLAQWIQPFFNLRVIAYLLGQDCLPQNKYLKFLNFSKLRIVAASDSAEKKLFSTTGHHASKIISLGLDADRFKSEIKEQPGIDILGVGNLQAVKNYSLFIRVIQKLTAAFPDLKAAIAGEGDEFNSIQNQINHLNLQKHITLLGRVERSDIIPLMHNCRILLHTSLHEGQGYVFDEALYSGMSVVAFDVGNIGTGEYIKIASSEAEMIFHLTALLNHPPLRIKYLRKDMGQTVDEFIQLYTSQDD